MLTRLQLRLALTAVAALLLAACGGGNATPTTGVSIGGASSSPAASAGASTAPSTAPSAAPTTGASASPSAAGTAAGGSQGGSGKKVKVAVVVKAVTSDYWKIVGEGVKEATASDPNITASFLGPNEETDIEGQIRILEAQISAKVDAIAVAPSQADQVQPTLQKAVDAGIPVVLIDTNIPGFKAKSAFVGTDNTEGGRLAGEYIAKQLKNSGDVAIIRGAAGDPVHNQREEGAKKALESAGLKIVATQPADSDRAKGQSAAENLLTAHPTLKAIFATNDEMALGAAQAAQAAGKKLIIVGFDASPDGLKGVQSGQISASVAQFPKNIGKLGTITAAKVARGEKVEANVNTGVDLVTKENLSKFMK